MPVFEMFPPNLRKCLLFLSHITFSNTQLQTQIKSFYCFNQFENNVSVPPALKFLRRCPLVMIFQYLRRQEYYNSTHTIFEKSEDQSADVLGEFLIFFESLYKWLPKFWFEVWLSEIAWGWKLPNLWVSWVKSCLS